MSNLIMTAMSGGVDSSVTALLLQQQGQPVAGMFMKNWEEDDQGSGCTAADDAADARSVAGKLDMRLLERYFAAEYRDVLFDHSLGETRAGRTSKPDILCTLEIKFRVFAYHARDLGAGILP